MEVLITNVFLEVFAREIWCIPGRKTSNFRPDSSENDNSKTSEKSPKSAIERALILRNTATQLTELCFVQAYPLET